MTVVTLAPNDTQQILRGTAARQWLDAHGLLSTRKVTLILPGDRRQRSLAAVTKDLILCLVMDCEDLTDFLASLAFDQAFEALIEQGVRRHARS